MAQVLPLPDNPVWDKRVESAGCPCLDEGSIPSSSTTFRGRELNPSVFYLVDERFYDLFLSDHFIERGRAEPSVNSQIRHTFIYLFAFLDLSLIL